MPPAFADGRLALSALPALLALLAACSSASSLSGGGSERGPARNTGAAGQGRSVSPIAAGSAEDRAASAAGAGTRRSDAEAGGIPPVPRISAAPLALAVQYPAPNQLLATRDSNFVLGRVGSGDVSLRINGEAVTVAPNGAFLAWLPVPSSLGSTRYDLVATRGADTARLSLPIRLPGPGRALPAGGPLLVDTASLQPGPGLWMQADDMVRVSVRAPRNARVGVLGPDNTWYPLLATGVASATSSQEDGSNVAAVFATDLAASVLGNEKTSAQLSVSRGADSGAGSSAGSSRDSITLPIPSVKLLPTDQLLLARLKSNNPVGSDTDRAVNARTIVNGTYKWLLLPGTVLQVTGRQQGFTRVRLDKTLDVWVDSSDLELMPAGSVMPRRITGGFRMIPARDWVDVVIGTGSRPAHLVEANDHKLTLTLYGVQANPEISPILGNDRLIERMEWEQVTSDRVRITFTLSTPIYGWLALWDDVRNAFVLRVRRPPLIDGSHPLRGIRIAVDPGHPPAGATGPTGLFEGDAVFPVAMQLVEMLRANGADAFSTRNSLEPLGLTERTVAARRADVHLFVSIHLNALPDGVNPFTNSGTSTLFFHNASAPLARFIEDELVARFGLRDLGVHYQNLAVARPGWYPSALAEGLFIMLPEQEAAMRDATFQRRYAEGLMAGIVRYLRWLGGTER